MAEFKKPEGKKKAEVETKPQPITKSVTYHEPRCSVCTSQFRKPIDRMIALGTSYSEISRIYEETGIDRRAISNHAKKHLNYEEAAIRQIIAKEAEEAQANIEEGVTGAIARRVYIDVAIQKGFEALLNNEVPVEVKDVATLIQLKEKMDATTDGAAIDEVKMQFNAFVQAIREVAPQEMWDKILVRTKEILNTAGELTPPNEDTK